MLDFFFRGLTSLASFVFPVLASYKSMEHNDLSLVRPWLIYWVVVALQLTFESYFGFILRAIPFYYLFRFLLTLWLVLPQFQGASKVYLGYVEPFLRRHEREIDECISRAYETGKSMSLEYVYKLMGMLQDSIRGLIFGPRSPLGGSGETMTVPTSGAGGPEPANQGGRLSWIRSYLWRTTTQEPVKPKAVDETTESSYWDMFLSKFRISEFPTQKGTDFLTSIFIMPVGLSKSNSLTYLDNQRTRLLAALKQLEEKRTMLEAVVEDEHDHGVGAMMTGAVPGGETNVPRSTLTSEVGSDFDVVLKDEDLADPVASEGKSGGWLWK